MNLSTVFPGASPKALRKTVVLALILALAAHGFCFFNLTYSGESVMGSTPPRAALRRLPPAHSSCRCIGVCAGRSARRFGSVC